MQVLFQQEVLQAILVCVTGGVSSLSQCDFSNVSTSDLPCSIRYVQCVILFKSSNCYCVCIC